MVGVDISLVIIKASVLAYGLVIVCGRTVISQFSRGLTHVDLCSYAVSKTIKPVLQMDDKFSYISDSCFKSRLPIALEAGVARISLL